MAYYRKTEREKKVNRIIYNMTSVKDWLEAICDLWIFINSFALHVPKGESANRSWRFEIFVTIRTRFKEIQEETSLSQQTYAKNTDAVKRRRLRRVMKIESLEKQVTELKNENNWWKTYNFHHFHFAAHNNTLTKNL